MNDEWLSGTYGYQSTHFKIDYRRMQTDVNYRMSYLQTNLLAAMVELGEAANEIPWKPWAATNDTDRQKLFDDGRHRFVGEMVDVLFFVANAFTAAGVTDRELRLAYTAKKRVNEARQESGTYDGLSTDKCERRGCNKALDEPGADVYTTARGRFCSVECVSLAEGHAQHAFIAKRRTVDNERISP